MPADPCPGRATMRPTEPDDTDVTALPWAQAMYTGDGGRTVRIPGRGLDGRETGGIIVDQDDALQLGTWLTEHAAEAYSRLLRQTPPDEVGEHIRQRLASGDLPVRKVRMERKADSWREQAFRNSQALTEALARAERAEAPLRAARFVEEHWRRHFMAGGNPPAAHALAMVRAALDGETDPAACGLLDDQHAGFHAAMNGSTTPDTTEETPDA